jgi:hypothetical protein
MPQYSADRSGEQALMYTICVHLAQERLSTPRR